MSAVLRGPRVWMAIIWTGFLQACIFTALVFAAVDPLQTHLAGAPMVATAMAIYSMAFFSFWCIGCVNGAMLAILLLTPESAIPE
jgi:hypothetical protein